MTARILAVDGGNSKTDLAIVDDDGRVLDARRGPTISHQAVGLEEGMRRLAALVAAARAAAGLDDAPFDVLVACLAGADLPADVRLLSRSLGALGLARSIRLHNDSEAILRGGTDAGWGIGVVCGAGVNAIAVAPDGRIARFAGLGDISGDRGGGGAVGMEGLGAAVRARDGRGPRTALERLVPEHFGLRRPSEVTAAAYEGRLSDRQIGELAPVVFRAAREGDAVAAAIVEQLAADLAMWVVGGARRVGLLRKPVHVVLGGAVARGAGEQLRVRVDAHVRAAMPNAMVTVLAAPPVVGAALLGLDELGRPGDVVVARVREGLTDRRLGEVAS